jgi:hypothetical protein
MTLALAPMYLYSCGDTFPESAWIARNSQGEVLPLVPQEEDNYCAVAAIAAHLQYWGENNPYTQSQMFWLADRNGDGKITFLETHDYFANYTNHYYWAVEYNWGDYQHWIADCMLPDPGTPPIISVGSGTYHFVSVVATVWTDDAYQPVAYVIADPSARGAYGTEIGIYGSYWRVEKETFRDWISTFVVGDSVLHLGMADQSSRWMWPASPCHERENETRMNGPNVFHRSSPSGAREWVDNPIPVDDAGGCPSCPPRPADTSAFYYNLAMQYIATMDTVLLAFIEMYCPGEMGWHFGPLRDVLFPNNPMYRLAIGQPGYIVVPVVTGLGYEIGSVLIFDGPGNAYGGCAFYPYLELLAKGAGRSNIDNVTLSQFALATWAKWKLDPESLIDDHPAKNIVSASSPGLEYCEVDYFFEWGPEPNVPFFHYAKITYPDNTVKIFDIFGVEYARGEDGHLYKSERIKSESGSEELTGTVPGNFMLRQNYPNPFNAATKIDFALPNDGQVKLEIYDILGQRVKTLVDEYRAAGRYSIEFDSGALASGMYFYCLTAGEYTETKKMILMK